MKTYIDYKSKDDLKITGLSQPTHITELQPEEASLIQRTRTAAAALPEIPRPLRSDSLNEEKVSKVPEVAARVRQLIEPSIAPQVAFDQEAIQELIEANQANADRLSDPAIPLPSHPMIDDLADNDKRSFLISLNELIGEMLQLLSKMGDRDRTKTDHMKKEYGLLNDRIGNAITDKANTSFVITVFMFGLQFIGGVNENAGRISQFLGQQNQIISGFIGSGYEVEQTKCGNKLSLISTEMQNTASKSGDNSGWRNELLQSLNDTKDLWKASVRNS